jgi:hypothetical protein
MSNNMGFYVNKGLRKFPPPLQFCVLRTAFVGMGIASSFARLDMRTATGSSLMAVRWTCTRTSTTARSVGASAPSLSATALAQPSAGMQLNCSVLKVCFGQPFWAKLWFVSLMTWQCLDRWLIVGWMCLWMSARACVDSAKAEMDVSSTRWRISVRFADEDDEAIMVLDWLGRLLARAGTPEWTF